MELGETYEVSFVYRFSTSPSRRFLLTDSLFVEFKTGTTEGRRRTCLRGPFTPELEFPTDPVTRWRDVLREAEREILDATIEEYPWWLGLECLARSVGKAFTGGTFRSYVRTLTRKKRDRSDSRGVAMEIETDAEIRDFAEDVLRLSFSAFMRLYGMICMRCKVFRKEIKGGE